MSRLAKLSSYTPAVLPPFSPKNRIRVVEWSRSRPVPVRALVRIAAVVRYGACRSRGSDAREGVWAQARWAACAAAAGRIYTTHNDRT